MVLGRCGIAAALLWSVAACAASRQAEERYAAFCAGQGLDPGSELFIGCVQNQRIQAAAEARRIRDMRGLQPPDR